jgi:hypothetical protein
LEACKEYEVRVRSNCTGLTSEYSTSIFFKTLCISGDEEAVAGRLGLVVSPNPFSNEITVGFHLEKSEHTTLIISDAYGRTLHESAIMLPAGEQRIRLAPELTAGVYFVRLKVAEGEGTRRVVKL